MKMTDKEIQAIILIQSVATVYAGTRNDEYAMEIKEAVMVTEAILERVAFSRNKRETFSNCCGEPILENTDLCSSCLEHCEEEVEEEVGDEAYNKASSNAGELI